MRRNRSKRTFGRWSGGGLRLAAIALVGAGVAACDGSNAFQPVSTPPQVVELTAPAMVDDGVEFDVNARAVGLVRVDSIVVTFEGAITGRQVETNTRPVTDVRAEFTFASDPPANQTTATYTAIAVDAQGNVSPPRTGTIQVRDITLPEVTLQVDPDSVFQGERTFLTVGASDNIGVSRLGVMVMDPTGAVVFADSAAVMAAPAELTWAWDVPEDPTYGTYHVRGFAVDLEGNRGVSATVDLTVEFEDRLPPVVEILTPGVGSAVPLFDSILVRVRVTDNDQVERIRFEGVSIRGDADLGTEEVRARYPAVELGPGVLAGTSDTTIARWIKHRTPEGHTVSASGSTLIPGDSISEVLVVRVTAEDAQGNETVTQTTVQLHADVSPPSVVIETPEDGLVYGFQDPFLVRATVRDDSGFKRAGVQQITFRAFVASGDPALGTYQETNWFNPVTVNLQGPERIIAPQSIGRLLSATSAAANAETPRQVTVIVTAWDGWWDYTNPVFQGGTLQPRRQIGADTVTITLMPPPPPPP